MKLSEAIRLGAMLGPQVRGVTSDGGGTCAMGAALLAIGSTSADYSECAEFPIAYSEVTNPVTGDQHVLFGVIRQLNDSHLWTREQIADWVETLEAAQPTDAPEPVTADIVR